MSGSSLGPRASVVDTCAGSVNNIWSNAEVAQGCYTIVTRLSSLHTPLSIDGHQKIVHSKVLPQPFARRQRIAAKSSLGL